MQAKHCSVLRGFNSFWQCFAFLKINENKQILFKPLIETGQLGIFICFLYFSKSKKKDLYKFPIL